MKSKYEFSYDLASGVLLVTLSGYLGTAELPRYLDLRAQAREDARQSAGRLRMLVDAREGPIQSAHTVTSVQLDWKDAIQSPSDKIAIVVSSQLHVLQARRTAHCDQVEIFVDAHEARQWLLAD